MFYVISGLVGCLGDAYRPAEALPREEATAFHAPHVEALARAGVDFLVAQTLPAVSEAEGLALAMARTGSPFLLSFVLRPTGALLDGTPLGEAVACIDALPSARTSRLSPEELDGRAELGTRLLGKCRGTDERHIAAPLMP